MTLFTGGGLALFAWRARDLRQGGIFAPISREGGARAQQHPADDGMRHGVRRHALSAGARDRSPATRSRSAPPYFNLTFGPLMVPLLLALPFGPFLAWKRGDVLGAAQRLMFAAVAGRRRQWRWLCRVHRGPWLAPFGIGARRLRHGGCRLRTRLAHPPRQRAAGRSLARVCAICRARPSARRWRTPASACMVVGIVATSAYREERILVMKPGEQVALAGYELTFNGVAPGTGPNYREEVGRVRRDARRRGRDAARAVAKRIYDMPPRADDRSRHSRRLARRSLRRAGRSSRPPAAMRCASISIRSCASSGSARVIMFLAGAVSLSDRRLRVGAPRPGAPASPRQPAE